MLFKKIYLTLLFFMFLVGCSSNQIKGSGKIITESHTFTNFNAININGSYQIRIVTGTEFKVNVTTDNNIMPHISVSVLKNALYIRDDTSMNLKPTTSQLEITVPKLTGINLAGINQLTYQKAQLKGLDINLVGTNQCVFAGNAQMLNILVAGHSSVDATQLIAQDVNVQASGYSFIQINVVNSLNVELAGAGFVKYKGSPKTVHKTISGVGDVFPIK